MHNSVLDFLDDKKYQELLAKILACGTTDQSFFHGHVNTGNYQVQQIPCEFAAYMTWLSKMFEGRPLRYLEIGSCAGGSLRHLKEAIPQLQPHSCDNMTYPECKFQAINFAAFQHELKQFVGDSKSADFRKWMQKLGYKFDVIFIDGDHMKDAVIADYYSVLPFVEDGGFIAFHDHLVPSSPIVEVNKAFEFFTAMGAFSMVKEFRNPSELQRKLGIAVTQPLLFAD
jgi:predicted O-methyltransferase YrrM